MLKDDKSFPYIFISDHEFPRIERHRGAKNKSGKYYGPFASSLAVNSAIKTLQRIFWLRSCTDKQVEAGDKTCFNYFLKDALVRVVEKLIKKIMQSLWNQQMSF